MPQPTMPPTPAPSTDIKGREYTGFPAEPALDLPPSAISQQRSGSDVSFKHQQNSADPISPVSPVSPKNALGPAAAARTKKRTASQAALMGSEENALPPPPTRSRKIIQVKPKSQDAASASQQQQQQQQSSQAAGADGKAAAAGGKRKQNSGTSAGRKIARKTAHSLIERRRRSKMNEEFGVLKDMIPACRGQEMHKLAILQASIDYLRYLEDCLGDRHSGPRASSSVASSSLPARPNSGMDTTSDGVPAPVNGDDVDEEDEEEVEEPQENAQPSPRYAQSDYYTSTFVSPALSATITSPAILGHQSSSYRPVHRQSNAGFELPSPSSTRIPGDRAYGPYHARPYAQSPHGQSAQSTQPSPMLLPQSSHSSAPSELDQEASAALLMLNASDRRGSISEQPKPSVAARPSDERPKQNIRGISVKDLLR